MITGKPLKKCFVLPWIRTICKIFHAEHAANTIVCVLGYIYKHIFICSENRKFPLLNAEKKVIVNHVLEVQAPQILTILSSLNPICDWPSSFHFSFHGCISNFKLFRFVRSFQKTNLNSRNRKKRRYTKILLRLIFQSKLTEVFSDLRFFNKINIGWKCCFPARNHSAKSWQRKYAFCSSNCSLWKVNDKDSKYRLQ